MDWGIRMGFFIVFDGLWEAVVRKQGEEGGCTKTTKIEKERRAAKAAAEQEALAKIDGKCILNEYPVAVYEVHNDYPVLADHEMPPIKSNVHMLPTLEEAADDYRYGSQAAFGYLYRYYERKIRNNAIKYDDEDIFQELNLVLMRCARRYRAGGSASFNTFFWNCVQNHLGMYQDRKFIPKRMPASGMVYSLNVKQDDKECVELGDMMPDHDAERRMDSALFYIDLKKNLFPHLSKRDQVIITKICMGESVSHISKQLKISMPGIYNRLKKLRKHAGAMAYMNRLRAQAHGVDA